MPHSQDERDFTLVTAACKTRDDCIRQGLQIIVNSFALPLEQDRLWFAKLGAQMIREAVERPCETCLMADGLNNADKSTLRKVDPESAPQT